MIRTNRRMATADSPYRTQALEEINKIPSEFLPALLKLMRAFREGVTLPSAEESFRQGWDEALSDQTYPISQLWEDLDVE